MDAVEPITCGSCRAGVLLRMTEQPEQIYCSIARCVVRGVPRWNQTGDPPPALQPPSPDDFRPSVNAGRPFLHLVVMSGLARIAASLDHTSVEVGERDFRDFSCLLPM